MNCHRCLRNKTILVHGPPFCEECKEKMEEEDKRFDNMLNSFTGKTIKKVIYNDVLEELTITFEEDGGMSVAAAEDDMTYLEIRSSKKTCKNVECDNLIYEDESRRLWCSDHECLEKYD